MPQEPVASHWWPTCGVMLGALTVALNIGVLNVAIPSMMSSLSTDLEAVGEAAGAWLSQVVS